MSHHVIHVPQQFGKVAGRGLAIFLEVILVPAAILASLGGAGQITLAIAAVFAWRIIVGVARWSMLGVLPVTSVLTFGMLSAKTGAGASFGLAGDTNSALIAYVLPGAIVSFFVGLYFIYSSFGDKPLVMKLAQDFVTLSESAKERLMCVFKATTLAIGAVNVLFASAGVFVVFAAEEEKASILTGALSVSTPIAMIAVSLLVALFMLHRRALKISFKEPEIETATSVLPAV